VEAGGANRDSVSQELLHRARTPVERGLEEFLYSRKDSKVDAFLENAARREPGLPAVRPTETCPVKRWRQ